MMRSRSLADSDAACGGKAVGLARLIAAGLPVPDGFVVGTAAFDAAAGRLEVAGTDDIGHALDGAAARIDGDALGGALPTELVAEVTDRAAALGVLAVRSSATIEDRAAGAAAGVFSSQIAVPAADVWPAIRAVWASALTPLAAAYARRRGEPPSIAVGVIVQRFVDGDRITVYTRPPGSPRGDEVWVQRGERLAKLPRAAPDPIVDLALRAEHAIGARDGADVELVCAHDRTWIVQARPIVHPAPRRHAPPPSAVLAPLVADGRRWTWDVAHNPDPLSVAQAGLVDRVERAGVAPWSLRVCAGFLYATPRGPRVLPAIASRHELAARAATLEARLETALEDRSPSGDPVDPVETAIARYLAFYAIWAELGTLIAAARVRLRPEQLAGARPSAVEATLIAAARGELDEPAALARLGVMSPAWDVAVPTFAERPELIRAAIERARTAAPRSREHVAPPRASIDDDARAIARAGADLAERDDLWFARAQWAVRRALLERAANRGIAADDVFWLPLDAPADLDRDEAHRRAAAARAAARRAASWDMPVVVGDDPTVVGPALHGIGTGTRVTGRVVRFDSLATTAVVGPADVVVTRAVTPALAVLVTGCRALISETGGALDHGAALARELGIPCVVACREAWTRLTDGMIVSVDGDAGTVVIEAADRIDET